MLARRSAGAARAGGASCSGRAQTSAPRLLPQRARLARTRAVAAAAAGGGGGVAPEPFESAFFGPLFGPGPFARELSPFARLDAQMDAQMRAMDAQLDAMRRSADSELARSVRELRRAPPGVRVERSESRGPGGSYSYYQSVTIRGGDFALTPLAPAHARAFSPLLAAALVLAGAWAAVAAAFAARYDLTTYREDGASRAKLVLLWPWLAATSRSFRSQFVSALRGVRVPVTRDGDAGAGGGDKGA